MKTMTFLIDDRDRNLFLHPHSPPRQLLKKEGLVGRFQQSGPQPTVHLHGTGDDPVRNPIHSSPQFSVCSVSSVVIRP